MFPVFAAAEPPPAASIVSPAWTGKPLGEDLARVYPQGAQLKNLEGKAIVKCHVTAQGDMADCVIEQEDPPGEGFGEATLKLAPLFHMKPTTADGASVAGGTVKIPISFRLPGSLDRGSPQFVAAQACYGQAARVVEHDPTATSAWRATVYWYVQIASLVAQGHGRPSEVETIATRARSAAEDGTLSVPKGSELEPCLAKAQR